ncbi:MAG: thiolase family protein [Proteobacteria bacterium]|nr:thiolase family protein [Pseudomonadota bacterium]MBU1452778.1 thiolase family protein [Pseudomonadota bacterium]MBU2469091.1 thiolase family protein [Pseudomonadota bacterium]MBU2519442.1 thiolase family protein [Pseudomonadota bacterium]
MANPVFISGAALGKFGRREDSLEQMMIEAASAALAQAELEAVDAVYLGVMDPGEFTGDSNLAAVLTDQLGLPGTPSSRVETASSTGAAVLETAFYAVASGYVQNALVVAGEKMTHLPTGETTRILARVIDRVERSYGATMPALAAMIARRYAHQGDLDEQTLCRALAAVAIKNHAGGAMNPYAQFQKEIDLDKYMASRMVADPLRIYDCAPISDGAAAMVLSSRPALLNLVGVGHATDTLAVGRRGSFTSFNSTKQAALKAYQMAGLGPGDIGLAEVHDAFTIFEIIGSEDLGFFPAGLGWKAALEGETGREGRLPINASGGLKARGHPVGASGLAQVVELAWQMSGQVEPKRQLNNVDVGLAQSIGGLANNNLVTILTRTDRKRTWQVAEELDYRPTLAPSRPLLQPQSLKPGRGALLTWTELYSPPPGFESPLDLGYVKLGDGSVILAHGRMEHPLKVGGTVTVDVEGEHFVFKHRDTAGELIKQIGNLARQVVGWWSVVEDASASAVRGRKAARLKAARKKRLGNPVEDGGKAGPPPDSET